MDDLPVFLKASEHNLHKPQLRSEGVTLVTNMVINMFVPASVTIAKLFVTSLKRSDWPRALDRWRVGLFPRLPNVRPGLESNLFFLF